MADYTPTEQESIDRLAEYNSNNYDPSTNEYGMGNGGHRTNFPLATDDTNIAANAISRIGDEFKTENQAIADVSASNANFKGLWVDLTGAASIPYSVSHSGRNWQLINNIADVALSEPGVSGDWTEIVSGAVEKISETVITSPVGSVVFSIPSAGRYRLTANQVSLGTVVTLTLTATTMGQAMYSYTGRYTGITSDSGGSNSSLLKFLTPGNGNADSDIEFDYMLSISASKLNYIGSWGGNNSTNTSRQSVYTSWTSAPLSSVPATITVSPSSGTIDSGTITLYKLG